MVIFTNFCLELCDGVSRPVPLAFPLPLLDFWMHKGEQVDAMIKEVMATFVEVYCSTMRNSYVPSSTLTHAIDLFSLRTFGFRELEALRGHSFTEEDPNCFVMKLDTLEGYCLTSLPDDVPQEICKNI
ncbi:1744_t:CDS:2 [Rhizophagus irregularis]|nr:1744_t:CDS:2 [Rhizophagus irregularis]